MKSCCLYNTIFLHPNFQILTFIFLQFDLQIIFSGCYLRCIGYRWCRIIRDPDALAGYRSAAHCLTISGTERKDLILIFLSFANRCIQITCLSDDRSKPLECAILALSAVNTVSVNSTDLLPAQRHLLNLLQRHIHPGHTGKLLRNLQS